jgi:hypothetical protein
MNERTNFFELDKFFDEYQKNIQSSKLTPIPIPYPPYSLNWNSTDKTKFKNIPWVVKEVKLK